MKVICRIPTKAKDLKGLTRALYKDDHAWYEGCATEAERIAYTKKWLGDGLEWDKGKKVIVYCL